MIYCLSCKKNNKDETVSYNKIFITNIFKIGFSKKSFFNSLFTNGISIKVLIDQILFIINHFNNEYNKFISCVYANDNYKISYLINSNKFAKFIDTKEVNLCLNK